MSNIIVEKYANLLTVRDIIELFNGLEKTLGSRVEAAKMCRLERKTIYGWEKTGEMRLKTKKKVLTALVDNLTEDILEFITKRGFETSLDLVRIYLSYLYENAIDKVNIEEFTRLALKFEQARQEYSGLIADKLELEVGNMSRSLYDRASEIKISVPKAPIAIVNLQKVSPLVPALAKIMILSPEITELELANRFNLPREFVSSLSTALREAPSLAERALRRLGEIRSSGTLKFGIQETPTPFQVGSLTASGAPAFQEIQGGAS